MRIKIGDKIYDANDEPIMAIFDPGEAEIIGKMTKEQVKFCSYPQGSDPKEIEKFMEFEEDNDGDSA